MRNSRPLLVASLVPALLVFGAVVASQDAAAQTAGQSKWSDPATWPNRKVPVAGDKVIIGKDKNVVLDVSPPALGGLSIDGKLTFRDRHHIATPFAATLAAPLQRAIFGETSLSALRD